MSPAFNCASASQPVVVYPAHHRVREARPANPIVGDPSGVYCIDNMQVGGTELNAHARLNDSIRRFSLSRVHQGKQSFDTLQDAGIPVHPPMGSLLGPQAPAGPSTDSLSAASRPTWCTAMMLTAYFAAMCARVAG